MAKGYKAAGEEATFTVRVKAPKAGSTYTLELLKTLGKETSSIKSITGPWKDGKEVKDGIPIEISGGSATVAWKSEGPPADGEDRQWRVFAKVTLEDDAGKKKEEKSPEVWIYNDWVEVNAVTADGTAIKNAGFKVLVNKRPIKEEPGRTGKGRTGDDGKKKVEKLPPGTITLQWERPWALEKTVEQKATTLKVQLKAAKKVKAVTHKGTSTTRPFKQYVNLDADPKVPNTGSKATITFKMEKPEAGDKIYVRQSFGGSNTKRNDVTVGLVGAAKESWAPKGGLALEPGKDGTAKVEVELGKAGLDQVIIEAGGTDMCKDVPPIYLESWRKVYYQLSHPEGMTVPSFAEATAALAQAGIELEEVKADRTVFKPTDANIQDNEKHWCDAADVGASGSAKFLIVGTHNAGAFHPTLFKKSKGKLQVHILLAHLMIEKHDPPKEEKSGEFSMFSPFAIVPFDGYVIKKQVGTTDDALVKGEWEVVDGDGKGTFAWSNLTVKPFPDAFVMVQAPTSTLSELALGAKVKWKLKMATHGGTYEAGAFRTNYLVLGTHNMENGGATTARTLNVLLAHEVGHGLKQAAHDGQVPPGMELSSHGFNYDYNGKHCAYGLSASDFATLDAGEKKRFHKAEVVGRRCTCVMYGAILDPRNPSQKVEFCPKCLPFVKARAIDTMEPS